MVQAELNAETAAAEPQGELSEAVRSELSEAFAALERKVSEVVVAETGRAEEALRRFEKQNRVLQAENARLSNALGQRLATGGGQPPPNAGDKEDVSATGDVNMLRSSSSFSAEVASQSPTLLSSQGNHAVITIGSYDGEEQCCKVPSVTSHAQHAIATMCARRHREAEHAAHGALSAPAMIAQASSGENTCEMLPFWRGLMENKVSTTSSAAVARVPARYRQRAQTAKFKDLISTGPMSKRRILWETVGTLLIISDLVTIPMQAFHSLFDNLLPPETNFLKACYWTLDILASFFVHFSSNGIVESRFRKTAGHYLRTWFSVDISLVILDWILIGMQLQASDNNFMILKAGRVLKLLRFVRLIRLFKLHTYFAKLFEATIHSEYILTFLNVIKIVISIIVINHFVACLWYTIGNIDWDNKGQHLHCDDREANTWVGKNFDAGDGLAYRYATSLHWSITQFTPASMEVVPRNWVERIFTVFVIILGMVTFSTFVSSITQAMTHLRKIAGTKDAQFAQLRQYLGENHVSMELAMRAWRYFEQGTRVRQQRTMWRQVELFADCPELLEMELQHEVYMPTLAKHPLFLHVQENSSAAMRAICHTAVRESAFRIDQDVFKVGQAVDKVYFVISGLLEYRTKCGGESVLTSASNILASEDIGEGRWISEAAMWVKWFHMGTAVAKVHSLVLVLVVPKLHEVVKEYIDQLPDCVVYGRLFMQQLRAQGVAMSDLDLSPEAVQDLAGIAFGRENNLHADRTNSAKSSKGMLRRGFSRLSHQTARWGDWLHADRGQGGRHHSGRSEMESVSEFGEMSPKASELGGKGPSVSSLHSHALQSSSGSVTGF